MASVPLYPPAPGGFPANFTKPTGDYKLRVVLVLLSLFLFLLIYLALIAGCGFVLYWAFGFPVGTGRRATGLILLRIILAIPAIMILLFLVKGLFKRARPDPTLFVEIHEENHPELFDFIERICEETRAPFPHRVFVSPEVNACVFYERSLFHLIVPARKNLLIGLGLVNALNLTEFKAVLAHEFGHFAQGSMKLGVYVYMANRIIADMIYGRDFWDDWLVRMSYIDVRLAIAAYSLMGIVWTLRKGLEGIFRVINFANSSLSQQMEFNADLVAVRAAGSDAIVHALKRLDFANDSLNVTFEDLKAAADHGMFTRDIFFHHRRAFTYLRKIRKNPLQGDPPELPADPNKIVWVFEEGDDGIPPMWADHPPNYLREENAKDFYVRSVMDTRTPWLLFGDPDKLRVKVTNRFYRIIWKKEKKCVVVDPQTVQEFIDQEHAETTYDKKYHGLYDDRFIEPGDPDELAKEVAAAPWSADRIAEVRDGVYHAKLEKWMEGHEKRKAEYQLLAGLHKGDLGLREGDFEFRDEHYTKRDVKPLLKQVDKELERDNERLAGIDKKIFQLHYTMAHQMGDPATTELIHRYRFQLHVQELARKLTRRQAESEALLEHLQTCGSNVSQQVMEQAVDVLGLARTALANALKFSQSLPLPVLVNMEAGAPLRSLLLDEELVYSLRSDDDSISGKWVGKLMRQLSLVLDRLKRVHFKSLGAILALQERLSAAWMARCEPRPVTVNHGEAP